MDEQSYWAERLGNEYALYRRKEDIAIEQAQPSMVLRPRLSIDGNQWCALYGDNVQNGVAGFGSSPEKAYADFDRAWREDLGKSKPAGG